MPETGTAWMNSLQIVTSLTQPESERVVDSICLPTTACLSNHHDQIDDAF